MNKPDRARLLALAKAATPGPDKYVANFLAKVAVEGDCLVWTASTSGRPGRRYGDFWNGRRVKAHQFAFMTWNGPIAAGSLVCHHCDNTRCVNPAHLYLGTPSDNVRDAVVRKRHRNGQSGKTHCPSGHIYSTENTYVYRTQRQCRICRDVHRGRAPCLAS